MFIIQETHLCPWHFCQLSLRSRDSLVQEKEGLFSSLSLTFSLSPVSPSLNWVSTALVASRDNLISGLNQPWKLVKPRNGQSWSFLVLRACLQGPLQFGPRELGREAPSTHHPAAPLTPAMFSHKTGPEKGGESSRKHILRQWGSPRWSLRNHPEFTWPALSIVLSGMRGLRRPQGEPQHRLHQASAPPPSQSHGTLWPRAPEAEERSSHETMMWGRLKSQSGEKGRCQESNVS